MNVRASHLWPGVPLALLSAALFGVSTPVAKLLLADVDPWMMAALLYLGAGVGLLALLSIQRARARATAALPSAVIDGERWLWPAEEDPASPRWQLDDALRLLAPFDPIVWDRARFAAFFGWDYRFEAYTPAARRKLGYYALPMLWRGEIRGWANLRVVDGRLDAQLGHLDGAPPADPRFAVARDEELDRVAAFLGASVG